MLKNKQQSFSAFTIIELLIVIAIISLLVTSIIFGYRVVTVRAKCTRIKSDFKQIDKAARLEWLTTNNWAIDVGTGVAPSFVPNYLAQWPDAAFYQNDIPVGLTTYDAIYDWEGWPDNDPNRPIKAISLRAPQPTPKNNDPNGHNTVIYPMKLLEVEFYYCVQDDQTNPTECFWQKPNKNPPPTPLNLGGNCPVR